MISTSATRAFFLTRCLLAGFLLVSGHLANAADEAQGYVDEARRFIDQGKLNAAVIQLKNALQEEPTNAQARLLLGAVYLRTGYIPSAVKELERARELGIDKGEWLELLGRAYLAQRQFDKVLADIVVDTSDPARLQSIALAMRGLAELAQGQREPARQKFQRALELTPENTDALLGQLQLTLLQADHDAALALADRILSVDADHIQARLARAGLYRIRKEYDNTLADFNKILELQPGNLNALLGRAETRIEQGELDTAMADVERVKKAYPDYPPANYLQGRILYQQQNLPGAKEALEKVMQRSPSHLPSQLLLGAINYVQGNMEQAETYLNRFVGGLPGHVPARKLLGAAEMKLGNPQAAIKALEPALQTAGEDPQLLALLGSAYLQAQEYEKGTEYLHRATELAPDISVIRAQLALSHLASGQLEQAVSELEQAVDLGQGLIQADVLLILTHLQKRDFDAAIDAADKLIVKLPDNPMPLNLKGIALMSKGQDEQARTAFEQALEKQPNFAIAAMNLAQLDIKADQLDAAESRYRRILDQNPGHVDAMLGLANLAQKAGDPIQTLNWLEQAWDKNPTSAKAGLALLQQYLLNSERLKALNVAQPLSAAHPENPLVLRASGLALMANDQNANALSKFRKLAELRPNHPEPWFRMAQAQVREKDLVGGGASLEKALEAQADYLPALVAKAEVQLMAGKLDAARETARDIQNRYPGNGQGYQLEGDTALRQNRPGEAAELYRQAYEKAPSGNYAQRLANALAADGDFASATGALRQWLAVSPDDAQVRISLAMYLQHLKVYPEAVKEYERVIELGTESYIVLNNLAWLYQEEGDSRAIAMAEQASQMAPDRPEVTDTLGWILTQNNQAQRGLVLLQQATVQAPHLADVRYHLAVAYAKTGRQEEARRELELLLSNGEDFADADAARALLEELKKASNDS